MHLQCGLLTKRCMLAVVHMNTFHLLLAADTQPSPGVLLPVDGTSQQLILQAIDDFVLQLPLGADRTSAEIEAAVSAELLNLHMAKQQLKQRLLKW
jgi:hypothetical protein